MDLRTAATALAVVLAVDSLIHLYWATGATWPARDTVTLSRAVLNIEVPFRVRGLIPLALLLATAAAVVLAQGGLIQLPLAPALVRWGTWAVAGGLTVRAVAGLVWATGIGADRRSVFYGLNLVLYTPLCVAGAAAGWWLAAAHR